MNLLTAPFADNCFIPKGASIFDTGIPIWNSPPAGSTTEPPELGIPYTAFLRFAETARTLEELYDLHEQVNGIAISQEAAQVNLSEDSDSLPMAVKFNQQLLEQCDFSDDTLNRINHLAALVEGWDYGYGQSINPLSLRNFLFFWLKIINTAEEPSLFLCSNGNIQAEWFKDSKCHLEIEFKRDICMFSLFDKEKFSQGLDSLDNLVAILLERKPSPLVWKYVPKKTTE